VSESHVVMLHASGQGQDSQWFDYRPSFFAEPVRVEWEKGTMAVALPQDVADFLVKGGYARAMTKSELEEYSAPDHQAQAKAQEPPPPQEEKADSSPPPPQEGSPREEEVKTRPARQRDKKGAQQ
jgi:hypothetical protein